MNNKFRQITVNFIVIPLIATGLILIANFTYFWWNFMRVSNIEMERFDDQIYQLNIPVRFVDRDLTTLRGHYIYAKNNYRYSLRIDDRDNSMWIAICRHELGGFAMWTARYEITDFDVKQKLLTLCGKNQTKTD